MLSLVEIYPTNLPGQAAKVQLVTFSVSPKFSSLQDFPPKAGEGFVQVRYLVRLPVPHVTEQLLHDDHWLKLPSRGLTGSKKRRIRHVWERETGYTCWRII